MKDARRGLHSLVEDIPPKGSLLELIEHSPAQVLNLFPSTQPSLVTWRNFVSLGPRRIPADKFGQWAIEQQEEYPL